MKPYLFKTPYLITRLYPSLLWRMNSPNKEVYLTFDDGPTPEVTPYVLDLLDTYNARATFFCIGKNIIAHPDIFKAILDRGHRVGNHTFNHLNARRSQPEAYLEEVKRTEEVILELTATRARQLPKLFRPPYGQMNTTLSKALLKEEYRIVMWSLLSADFDPELDRTKSLQKLKAHGTKGSIIVFHDSFKAYSNLKALLPQFLEHIKEEKIATKLL